MGCAILMTPYVLVELGIDFFDYSTHAMGDFTIGSTHYVVANRTYDLPGCVNCHNATSVAYWRNRTYYEGTSFICCTYPGEVFEQFASFMLPNYSLFEPLESLFVYGFHHLRHKVYEVRIVELLEQIKLYDLLSHPERTLFYALRQRHRLQVLVNS